MIIMSVEKRFIAAWYFCGNCGTIGVTQSKGLGYDKKRENNTFKFIKSNSKDSNLLQNIFISN